MIRWLITAVLGFIANAIGLWAASYFLEGFDIHGTAFLMAVLIFSVTTAILGPFVAKVAVTRAPFLMGGISLVSTLVGLIITNIISSGISIHGLSTWLMATLIVWLFSMLGNVILPLIVFKMFLDKRKDNKNTPPPAAPATQ